MSPINLPDTNPAFRPRPANLGAPPHPPLIGPTGSPGLNSVIDVVNTTAAPFMNAPPPEQGAAGWVAQGLGGVLGIVGAPAMIIDTAFASLTAPIAALFPAMPAVTLPGLHLGPPHAHTHPPSWVPPAPAPVPLPSFGPLLGAGAVTVLIGGLPAARAGDIGIALTCGSLAPPFEVYTGSSNVFIGGARAARWCDITKHCNPTSMGPFAIAMGAAGVVAGAAGAVATSNVHAAAQAAADAAVLAIKLLCGKDPGIPPGLGNLVGPPIGSVRIGGFPCPPIGEMAFGALMKAIGKAVAALRRGGNTRRANGRCANGLEPVYLPTGEYFDSYVDYASDGAFEWKRHYSSARCSIDGSLGRGVRHFLQRSLTVRLHRAVFTDWDGETIEFPRFQPGSNVTRGDGYVLRRESVNRYSLAYRNSPTMEFTGRPFDGELPLTKLRGARSELELHYDRGLLAECVDARNQQRWEFERDGDGHIVAVYELREGDQRHARHERMLRARYRYSTAGELLNAQDALGGVWSYEYDTFHRIVKQTDPRGYSFSFSYDTLGRCVASTGQDGLWSGTIEYLPDKKVTRCTSGNGETWEYHYDNDGFVTKIIDPYGGEKVRERDGEGRVREVDCGGRELRWLYDGNGAHYARQDRFGYLHPPETESRDLRNPFARTLPNTSRSRCFAGTVAMSTGTFEKPERILDTIPRPCLHDLRTTIRLHNQQAGASPSRVERNALGHIVREIDALGRTRSWERDATGNVTATRDRDGRITEPHIGSWNLVIERRDPLGNGVRYRYSPTEQITAIQDRLGNTSLYDYDLKGRLIRVRRNNRIREEYVYDVGDHFIEKRNGTGAILFTNQIHDNHLVGLRQLASGGIHRYDYDAAGRVIVASTAEHDIRLGYDDRGRRIADLRDDAGVQHRFSDGSCDTRIFDRFAMVARRQAKNAVRLIDAANAATVLRHYRSGIVQRLCSNGTVEILQYDGDGKLTGRLAYNSAHGTGATAWSVRYSYSAEGDLLRVSDSIRGVTVYETDAAHRLVSRISDAPRREVYEYDAASNVISLGAGKRLDTREGNRLSQVGRERYEYDERDHLATRSGPGKALARCIYDSFDMLVRVERTTEDGRSLPDWEARYDGLGRRICTQVGTTEREFYWDGDRLAAEILPDKTFRIYQYGGPDALVPLHFTDYPNTQANPSNGRTYHVFCDQVGMPLHIEDQRGAVVWWADDVSPYGSLKVRRGATVEYNLRWPGHYYDPEIGLHCNRYRYYDPTVARYLQPDPLGYEGSPINLYSYCGNPVVDVDVLGLTNQCGNGDGAQGTKEKGDVNGQEVDPDATNPNIRIPILEEEVNGGSIRLIGDEQFRDAVKADLERIESTPTGKQLLGEIQDNHTQHGTQVDIFMGPANRPHAGHSADSNVGADGSPGKPVGTHIGYTPQEMDSDANMSQHVTTDRQLVHELDHASRNGKGQSQTNQPADPDGVPAPNREEQLAVDRENQYANDRGMDQRKDYDHVPGVNDEEYPD